MRRTFCDTCGEEIPLRESLFRITVTTDGSGFGRFVNDSDLERGLNKSLELDYKCMVRLYDVVNTEPPEKG